MFKYEKNAEGQGVLTLLSEEFEQKIMPLVYQQTTNELSTQVEGGHLDDDLTEFAKHISRQTTHAVIGSMQELIIKPLVEELSFKIDQLSYTQKQQPKKRKTQPVQGEPKLTLNMSGMKVDNSKIPHEDQREKIDILHKDMCHSLKLLHPYAWTEVYNRMFLDYNINAKEILLQSKEKTRVWAVIKAGYGHKMIEAMENILRERR
ncbi:hypothetical protein [Bacillus cytotoxicus]|uniref:hypothetical protein n=1 Tax=Bacillus cytotoxicus TaxID=580165 RepID=UPI000863F879|nr:hypothetical protein [Bacillus cytotoxicus]AWC29120.1 hypothetical protein CG483_012795 [Bacillus cytotoxicus]AWC39494.1 hypothetical protein CG480_002455 [Bacillus cytotoxicus]AWC47425.1 hypothetical protein CG478_002455 [Bacillus cytotoxicus]AWC53191.1 hypothetical protein CG477_012755 [Bacillus cytotoxicus]AWC57320.1 hypothetical protein CG476_012780 [Bacillus cytotoxicus]